MDNDPDVALALLDAEHHGLCDEYGSLNDRFRELLQSSTNLKARFAPLEAQYGVLAKKFHALARKYRSAGGNPTNVRERDYSERSSAEEELLEQYRNLIQG
ncbi:hypothetical protein [Ktedonospora formicarum]|uniref:hypothetical protein n=1 Tax=Ktedonospora formicarum TaxID=2778364 RepID=UPI001C687756|nr:hypothetical protein [Ktedonospora formicarum]